MTRCERCWDQHGVTTPIPDGARWCDPCASEDDDFTDEVDMTAEDWTALEDALEELERTDPVVKRAARRLEQAKDKILRSPHIATGTGDDPCLCTVAGAGCDPECRYCSNLPDDVLCPSDDF